MPRKPINFSDWPELPFEEFAPKSGLDASQDSARQSAPAISDHSGSPDPGELLYYLSMGSGSSGNCCYIGSKKGGVLIDAGVRADQVEMMLKANGLSMNNVKAILLTHDHSDHVKYVYTILRTNKNIKVFCTNRVLAGLLRRHNISKRIKEYHIPIFKEIPFKIFDMEFTAFDVPHDGSDNMGFSLDFDGRRFVLATDLGAVTERARHYMTGANYLVIESNYDAKMLRDGRYPEYLKARIATDHGHMDNVATAAFLKEIAGNGLEYVFLCHLSQDNNLPELAFNASHNALTEKGLTVGRCGESMADLKADIQLMTLPRFGASRLFVFRRKIKA